MKSRLYPLIIVILLTLSFAPPMANAKLLHPAQVPSNAVVDTLNRLFTRFTDFMFELDKNIGQFIRDYYALLLTQKNVTSNVVSTSDIHVKYALTDFVAYQDPFAGEQKASSSVNDTDQSDIEEYLDKLQGGRLSELLQQPHKNEAATANDDKITKAQPDIKDSLVLVEDSIDRMYCRSKTRRDRCFGKSAKEQGNLCEYEKNYLCVPNKKKSGIKISSEDVRVYDTILKYLLNCKPNQKENKTLRFSCSQHNKDVIYQKILQMILQPKYPIDESAGQAYKDHQAYKRGDESYNSGVLLNNLTLPNDAKKVAQAFVETVDRYANLPSAHDSNLYLPHALNKKELENVNKAAVAANKRKKGDPDPKIVDEFEHIKQERAKYFNMLRQLLAVKSIIMHNFYYLYAERLPQSAIIKLNLKDEHGQPISSALQLKAYLAKQKLTPDYIEKMSKISPYFIERQQLFVLSSIQKQLLDNKLLQEKVLSTLSAIALILLKQNIMNNGNTLQPLANTIQSVLTGSPSVSKIDPSSAKRLGQETIEQNTPLPADQ